VCCLPAVTSLHLTAKLIAVSIVAKFVNYSRCKQMQEAGVEVLALLG
jgi:hypothetical protein